MDTGTHTGMWIQVRTQVCRYRYAHRYVDTGTHTGMWIQVHTQVCGYRYAHRYTHLLLAAGLRNTYTFLVESYMFNVPSP